MAITSNYMLISNRTAEWVKQKTPATYGLLLKGSTVACVGKVALTIITLGVPLVLALTYDGALAIKHSITPAPKKPVTPKKEQKPESKPAPEPEPFDKVKDYANMAAGYASSFGKGAYSAMSSTGSVLYTGGKVFWELSLPAKVAAVAGSGILINKTLGIGNTSSAVTTTVKFVWDVFALPFAKAVGRGFGEAVKDGYDNLPAPVEIAEGAWNFGNFLYDNAWTIGGALGGVFSFAAISFLSYKVLQQAAKPPLAAGKAIGGATLNAASEISSAIDGLGNQSVIYLGDALGSIGRSIGRSIGLGEEVEESPELIAKKKEFETYKANHKGCTGSIHEDKIRKFEAEIAKLKDPGLSNQNIINNIKTLVHVKMDDEKEAALSEQLFILLWVHGHCLMSEEDYKEAQKKGKVKFLKKTENMEEFERLGHAELVEQYSYYLSYTPQHEIDYEYIDNVLKKLGYANPYFIPSSAEDEDFPEISSTKTQANQVAREAREARETGTVEDTLKLIETKLKISLSAKPVEIGFQESFQQTLPDFAIAATTATASATAISALSGLNVLYGGIPTFLTSLALNRGIHKRPPIIKPAFRAIADKIPGNRLPMPNISKLISDNKNEITQAVIPALSLAASYSTAGLLSPGGLMGFAGTITPFIASKFFNKAQAAGVTTVAADPTVAAADPIAPRLPRPLHDFKIEPPSELTRTSSPGGSSGRARGGVYVPRAPATRAYRVPPARGRRQIDPLDQFGINQLSLQDMLAQSGRRVVFQPRASTSVIELTDPDDLGFGYSRQPSGEPRVSTSFTGLTDPEDDSTVVVVGHQPAGASPTIRIDSRV